MAGKRTMGTALKMIKTGSEASDLVIAHIQSIGDQSTETDEIDVTTLDSPNGAKEYMQGAKDPGTVEITANNCGDGQVEALQAVFDSGKVRTWTETYPTGATLTYDAYISAFTFGEATVDGLMTASFTLRLSGEPVYTEAESES